MKTTFVLAVTLPLYVCMSAHAIDRSRCDSVEKDGTIQYAEPNHPVELPHQLLNPQSTFSPDAKIECQLNGSGFSREPFKLLQVERGKINGVPYRVWYSDGSGSFPNNADNSIEMAAPAWRVFCKRDDMDDSKMCFANYENLFIYVLGRGREIVSVGHSYYPDSEIAIRFDDGTPLRASAKNGFSAVQSKTIIERLKRAKSVVTRYQEWPYEANQDEKWNIYNFEIILNYLRWAVKNM